MGIFHQYGAPPFLGGTADIASVISSFLPPGAAGAGQVFGCHWECVLYSGLALRACGYSYDAQRKTHNGTLVS